MNILSILSNPCGDYQTNCYIIKFEDENNEQKEIIIDPGMGATSWVSQNVTNPLAILNTHGHFDHVWSNQELKARYDIPIYCPSGDVFMLQDDPFDQGTPKSEVDFAVEYKDYKSTYNIGGLEVVFHHFAGHTPGCSVITIKDDSNDREDNIMFSGDFIFNNSIGRVDFPYSVPSDMKDSINRVLEWSEKEDFIIHSGHGASTTLNSERDSLKNWLNYI